MTPADPLLVEIRMTEYELRMSYPDDGTQWCYDVGTTACYDVGTWVEREGNRTNDPR